MPSLKDEEPDLERQVDAKDHQRDENGRRGEIAARSRRRRRPRVPSPCAWSAVLGNLAEAAKEQPDGAAPADRGPAEDLRSHLLIVVATADAAFAAASTARSSNWRGSASARSRRRQDVKILTIGKKGRRATKPRIRRDDDRPCRSRRRFGSSAIADAQAIAAKVFALFNDGEFDICTLFYNQFKSVISQIPRGAATDPGGVQASRGRESRDRRAIDAISNMSRTRRRSSRICCRSR